MSNLLLIDSRVSDIDAILSSLTPNTKYIVFKYEEDTFQTLKHKISDTLTQYTQIAIAQHKYGISTYSLVSSMVPALLYEYVNGSPVSVAELEPQLESWQPFTDFIHWLVANVGLQYLDLLACDLWADSNWVYVINTLKHRCSVSIRASIDVTGFGGDFILESDNANLIGLYFTDKITEYKYSFVGNDFITLINTKSPWGVYCATKYSNVTNKLYELRNNGRDATVSGTLTPGKAAGNGSPGVIPFLNGTTTTSITWPAGSIPTNHTIAFITRYTNAGGGQKRILSGKDYNILLGHHNAKRGVVYIPNSSLTTDVTKGTITNWVNMVTKTGGTAPNNLLLDTSAIGNATIASSPSATMVINNHTAYGGEYSDFGFSYLMIWDQVLTDAEMIVVSDQLQFYLNTGYEPPVLSAFQTVINDKRPWGIYRAIDWVSGTNTLPEGRGITARDASGTGITFNSTSTGNGASGTLTSISGTTSSIISWPSGSIPTTYTVAFITRYTGVTSRRILTGSSANVLFGHSGGSRGVYYDKTEWINTTSYGTANNWLGMVCKVSANPNNCIVDDVSRGTTTSTVLSSADRLYINSGTYSGESSTWEFSYLLIWDQALTDTEAEVVSNELLSYIGTGTLPDVYGYVLNGYFTYPALGANTYTNYTTSLTSIPSWSISIASSNSPNVFIANTSTYWGYALPLPNGVSQWLVLQYVGGSDGFHSMSQTIYFDSIGLYALRYYTQSRSAAANNLITLTAGVGSTTQSGLVSSNSAWELRTLYFPIGSIGTQTLSLTSSFSGGSTDCAIYISGINIAAVDVTPNTPTIVSLIPGYRQITMNFTPPTSNGSTAITTYKYSLNDGEFVNANTTTSPITITGLLDGTLYSVRIVATNGSGDSSISNPVSVATWNIPGKLSFLGGNTDMVLFGSNTQVQYSVWNGANYNASTNIPISALPNKSAWGLHVDISSNIYLASYLDSNLYASKIDYEKTYSTTTVDISGALTSYTVSNLIKNTSYDFSLISINQYGQSFPTTTTAVTADPLDPPVISIPTIESTTAYILLCAPTQPVTSYTSTIDASGFIMTRTHSDPNITWTGLLPNKTYTYSVYATDASYTSTMVTSTFTTSLTPGRPFLPTIISRANYIIDLSFGVPEQYLPTIYFNGSTQVAAPSATVANYTTGTIECWIRTNTTNAAAQGILVKPNAYGLLLNNYKLNVYNWSSNSYINTNIALNDNIWHHIAFVFQSGVTNGSTIYIDGLPAATTTYTVSNQTGILHIGSSEGWQYFTGYIHEVRIWNTARTAAEIALYANKRLPFVVSGLTGYYTFYETSGTTINNLIKTGGLPNFTLNLSSQWTYDYVTIFDMSNTRYTITTTPASGTASNTILNTSYAALRTIPYTSLILLPNTQYTITIKAANSFGTSSSSPALSTSTTAISSPNPPASLAITAFSTNSVTVQFIRPSGITSSAYQVYAVSIAGRVPTIINTVSSTSSISISSTITGMVPFHPYAIYAVSGTTAPQSVPSNVVYITLSDTAPSVVASNVLTTTATLTITPATNYITAFYTIIVNGVSQTSTSTTVSLTGLTGSTLYNISVYANTAYGISLSSSTSFITDGAPSAPSGFAIQNSYGTSINTSFTPFTGSSSIPTSYSVVATSRTQDVTGMTLSNFGTQSIVAATDTLCIAISDPSTTRIAIMGGVTNLQYSRIINGTWNSAANMLASVNASQQFFGCAINSAGTRAAIISNPSGVNATRFIFWANTSSILSSGGVTTLTQTAETTARNYRSIAMTKNGDRIVCGTFSDYLYIANWNGTTFTAFTRAIPNVSTRRNYTAVCISRDNNTIAYSTSNSIYWAAWNGTTYTTEKYAIMSQTANPITAMSFIGDASNVIMYAMSATTGAAYLYWNGANYVTGANIATTAIPAGNNTGLAIDASNNIYVKTSNVASVYSTAITGRTLTGYTYTQTINASKLIDTTSCVGYYKLDGTDYFEQSVFNYKSIPLISDASFINSPTFGATSGYNETRLTATSSNYIGLPTFTIGTAGLGFACWFRSNATVSTGRLFDFGTSAGTTAANLNNMIYVAIISNLLKYEFFSSTGTGTGAITISATNYNDNVYRHFAFNVSAQNGSTCTVTAYINGTLVYTGTNISYPSITTRSSNMIGRSNYTSNPFFNGAIFDVLLYTRPFTTNEISMLYGTPNGIFTPIVKLPSLSGYKTYDLSINAINAYGASSTSNLSYVFGANDGAKVTLTSPIYNMRQFNTPGAFTIPGAKTIYYVMVAGGGCGPNTTPSSSTYNAAGAGGGGIRTGIINQTVTTTYYIDVPFGGESQGYGWDVFNDGNPARIYYDSNILDISGGLTTTRNGTSAPGGAAGLTVKGLSGITGVTETGTAGAGATGVTTTGTTAGPNPTNGYSITVGSNTFNFSGGGGASTNTLTNQNTFGGGYGASSVSTPFSGRANSGGGGGGHRAWASSAATRSSPASGGSGTVLFFYT
jgi:hypothetical protein